MSNSLRPKDSLNEEIPNSLMAEAKAVIEKLKALPVGHILHKAGAFRKYEISIAEAQTQIAEAGKIEANFKAKKIDLEGVKNASAIEELKVFLAYLIKERSDMGGLFEKFMGTEIFDEFSGNYEDEISENEALQGFKIEEKAFANTNEECLFGLNATQKRILFLEYWEEKAQKALGFYDEEESQEIKESSEALRRAANGITPGDDEERARKRQY